MEEVTYTAVNKNSDCDEVYVASLNGPILLTAPHSSTLKREVNGEFKTHLRERFTSTIVLMIAEAMKDLGQPNSYVVWDKKNARVAEWLDPNYLRADQQDRSCFH